MPDLFEPTPRDLEGLERLEGEIRRDQAQHEGYHVSCFAENEALWIQRRLQAWRPDLVGRLTVSWLTFRRPSDA